MVSTFSTLLLGIALGVQHAAGISLNVSDEVSIRQAAETAARGLLSYYTNNETTAAGQVGLLTNPPYYWWESGAMWGAMLDYWKYTGDTAYEKEIMAALTAQLGPKNDFIMQDQVFDTGNDDQSFWAVNAMTAAEYGFPSPPAPLPNWEVVAANVFNDMAGRWNTSTCNGGLTWQIYASNVNGLNYKNSISNGGFFQIAARLARFTGNATYADWANRIWDWTAGVGLIDESNGYAVYDGTDDTQNCTSIDHDQWTYNAGMFVYGAAAMANISSLSSSASSASASDWTSRAQGLVNGSAATFFSPFPNATNVMFEAACEKVGTCDTDQFSFKGFLARWLSKSSILAPALASSVDPLLEASARAAAQSCDGLGNSSCGTRWWVGGFDGETGAGQQMSALEVLDSLLVGRAGAPLTAGAGAGASSSSASSSATTAAAPTTLSTVTSSSAASTTAVGSTTTPAVSATSATSSTITSSVRAEPASSSVDMGGLASAIQSAASKPAV
ncbi:MAG: hypothetical protein M1822_006787 [Bathelium mastoideum]|nr:MAG: hypothetical protein M1822_006787 [Bathelium mastoideum]